MIQLLSQSLSGLRTKTSCGSKYVILAKVDAPKPGKRYFELNEKSLEKFLAARETD